jgi:hypothetical protein
MRDRREILWGYPRICTEPGGTCPPLYCSTIPTIEAPKVKEQTPKLPLDMQLAGFRLLQFIPQNRDPWVLYDQDGKTVCEWRDEPSFFELLSHNK